MKAFFAKIWAWVLAHKVVAICIAAGTALVIATAVAVPVGVSSAKKKKAQQETQQPDSTPSGGDQGGQQQGGEQGGGEQGGGQSAPTYTVVWKNDNGAVLETDTNVAEGSIPSFDGADPTKASTAQYDYAFTGWAPTLTAVTADAEYTATYSSTVRKYTVQWLDEDENTVLKSEQVNYGDMPTPPANPEKADTAEWDYSFNGWDHVAEEVHGNQTYTATYSSIKKKYSVTFLDEDGITELKSEQVNYGEMPTPPANPEKADTAEWDYSFNGWDHALEVVHGNQSYTATYSSVKQKYTVTFLDEDGETVLQSGLVDYGEMPTPPADPTKEKTADYVYTFDGWDNAFEAVHGNQTYTATYSSAPRPYFSVSIVNPDLSVVWSSNKVDPGTVFDPFDYDLSYDDGTSAEYVLVGFTSEPKPIDANRNYIALYMKMYFDTDHYEVEGLTSSNYWGDLVVPDTYKGYPVTEIGYMAFSGITAESITIGTNVSYIGARAFDSVHIPSIEIPGNVTLIDSEAFKDAIDIKEITFNEGLVQVRDHAFENIGVRELVLPASLSIVGQLAFQKCHSLIKATLKASDFSDYHWYNYGTIFEECGSLTELICPNADTAYSLGYDNQALAVLNSEFKDRVGIFEFVDEDVANNELGKVYYTGYGSSTKYLVGVFGGNGTKKVLHANNATNIKKHAFYGNPDIDEIYISTDITSIGGYAFCSASNVKIVEFEDAPEKTLYFGGDTFNNMEDLESVDMSKRRITNIGSYEFAYDSQLRSVVLSPYTTSLGGFAFFATAIEEIEIPATVTSIDTDTFRSTRYIERFIVDGDNAKFKSVDDCLFSKDGTQLIGFATAKEFAENEYTVPEGVTQIIGRVFQSSTKITKVNLPSTLTKIGELAFYNTDNITTVTYPGTVAEFEALDLYKAEWGSNTWAYECSFASVTCSNGPSTKNIFHS